VCRIDFTNGFIAIRDGNFGHTHVCVNKTKTMATRKRTQSTIVDSDNVDKWTIARLREELMSKGITVPVKL